VRTLDRIFGWLMIAAALLQAATCTAIYHHAPELLLWSLTACLAELLLGGINLIRAERRHDVVVARLCVAGNAAWIAVTVASAVLMRHFLEARVLLQLVVAATLLGLSMRARRRSRPM
jgi:hypothetical protein